MPRSPGPRSRVTVDRPDPQKSQGSRAPGKETAAGRAPHPRPVPPPPPDSAGHIRPGTHCPSLCSPGVGPAAEHAVQMRPGCCSRVGSAGGISRAWARRAKSQQRFGGSAPYMAQQLGRPRPPAALLPCPSPARPPPARLPQSKPAAPAGNAACHALPRVSTPQSWQRCAATASPTPPDPARPTRATAPDGTPRGTLGVVVRAAQPRRATEDPGAVRRKVGSAWTPTPNPWASGRGGEHPHRTVGGESGVCARTRAEFSRGPAPHLEER